MNIQVCPVCGGRGRIREGFNIRQCYNCNGKGYVVIEDRNCNRC